MTTTYRLPHKNVTKNRVRKLITEFMRSEYGEEPREFNIHLDDGEYAATVNALNGHDWAYDFADWVDREMRYEDLGSLVEIIDPLSSYEIGIRCFPRR